jgi:hypothetical protein
VKTIALLTVTALLVLTGPVPAESAVPGAAGSGVVLPAAEPCDWGREYHHTLASLGEPAADWHIIDMAAKRPGVYAHALLDTDTVELGKDMPCPVVSSVIRHEWVHLQQGRMYGGHLAVLDAYQDRSGEVMEFVADCAAGRLGATYQPYLRWGTGACDESWPRAEADRLIRYVMPAASDTPMRPASRSLENQP